METAFSRTMVCDKTVTRELVLSLAALLRRLAAAECGCLESELGGGITLYRGPDAMRFETPEELSAAVPPLEPLDAFRMTFFCDPFPRPGEPFVSLFVGMDPGGSMQITASAASTVRAQELGLEVVDFLSLQHIQQVQRKREPKHRKRADHDSNRPKKFYNSGTFWAAVGAIATVSAAFIALLALLHSLGFL